MSIGDDGVSPMERLHKFRETKEPVQVDPLPAVSHPEPAGDLVILYWGAKAGPLNRLFRYAAVPLGQAFQDMLF